MASERKPLNKVVEFVMERAIFMAGILSIVLVVLVFLFLLKEGFSLFKTFSPFSFFFGSQWYPISTPAKYGILPLLTGSLAVTLGAIFIAVPLGLAAAIFIAEIAPLWLRDILKTTVEFLAAIPSIVLGFIGLVTLVPLVKRIFHLPTGLTGLSGSIMLGFMAMPTIVSMMEDAFTAVPQSYREGALALGATKWQTIYRVLVPAASTGMLAAIMLGIGRVIGETMAVMMITGNAARIPTTLLVPVRTMTATIAAEMGEAVHGSEHYYALFAIGIVLFCITFLINFTASFFIKRKTRK